MGSDAPRGMIGKILILSLLHRYCLIQHGSDERIRCQPMEKERLTLASAPSALPQSPLLQTRAFKVEAFHSMVPEEVANVITYVLTSTVGSDVLLTLCCGLIIWVSMEA